MSGLRKLVGERKNKEFEENSESNETRIQEKEPDFDGKALSDLYRHTTKLIK